VHWLPEDYLGSSGSLLPTKLPLFSRLIQLPIPLGVDLLLTLRQHVLRRYWGRPSHCQMEVFSSLENRMAWVNPHGEILFEKPAQVNPGCWSVLATARVQ